MVQDLIKDQFSNIIWFSISALTFIFRRSIGRRLRRLKWYLTSFTLRLIAAQIAALFGFCVLLQFFGPTIAFSAFSLMLAALPVFMLRRFRKIGLGSAFLKTNEGVDFDTSLDLAASSFEFLGIGAHKLVNSSSFDEAMVRCATNGQTAKFLLSDPDNPALERMARRNGVDPQIYKKRVNESINKLIDLRDQRGLNIEIRLYTNNLDADYQRFRLVFIDESFCLLGWTVWGAHEGKENPQLVLRNTNLPPNSGATMYKAFKDYYDEIWERATVR